MSIPKCRHCQDRAPLPFDFSMAFQPIVDVERGSVWAYEALVRGTDGAGAYSVLSQVNETNRYQFDQACRVKAIELAAQLFLEGNAKLSINFMPNAVYEPASCIRASLEAAERTSFPRERLMFEFTETEQTRDVAHLQKILKEYSRHGFITAIDDFGAGFSGLGLLADFRPDVVKIDMHLVRDIGDDFGRRAIVAGIIGMLNALDITVIAEGIERAEECAMLRRAGVRLFQGYHFAKPAFEALPDIANLDLAEAA